MRSRSLIGTGRIATALAVAVGWLVVTALVDRPPSVPVAHAATGTFANTTSIAIPGTGPAGPASPYPSTINVAGLAGTVTKVTATINVFTHTFPDDVDVLLVGPTGATVVLMSDTGDGADVVGVTLTFDDAAAGSLPDSTQIVSGTFRPTNVGGTDAFPAPAPAGPHGSTLSVFNGTNPNGQWQLFVVDDFPADSGSFAGGWSLTIETLDPTPTPTPTPTNTPTVTPTVTPTPTNTPTPQRLQGCAPGYWKQPHHLDSWSGFTPGQTLESVFDVPDAFGLDDTTLLAALDGQGGPTVADAAELLLRQAAAALLNAASPTVDYPLSVNDVINRVNAALASGDRSTILALASELDRLNNLGCPLN
jgi:subtilisin-like proprotein convertase family protein